MNFCKIIEHDYNFEQKHEILSEILSFFEELEKKSQEKSQIKKFYQIFNI